MALPEPAMIPSLLAGGFAAAFLHAALPTHWLPFVLVGRAQQWKGGRILAAAAVAGLAHVAVTALVGGLAVLAGLALNRWIGGVLEWISAALLLGFGLFYLARAFRRRTALAGGPDFEAPEPRVSDSAAFLGLAALLAASPGEVLLPIYLSSAQAGLSGLLALTAVFAVGTVAGMAVFIGLACAGAALLRLERLARYESLLLGVALIALGLLMILHQH